MDLNTEKDRADHLQRIENLRMLYPIFKGEVYARREQMMKIAGLSSAFLLTLLVSVPFLKFTLKPDTPARWLFALGVLIFTGLSLYHIRLQRDRHSQAKQAVIDTEKALGLFEEGTYFPDRGLFPQSWKTRPRDWSIILYPVCLLGLAGLVILSLLI